MLTGGRSKSLIRLSWLQQMTTPTGLPQNFVVDPVPQSDAIHFLSQCHFGARSLLPHLRHAATDLRRRGLDTRRHIAFIRLSLERN